MKSFFSLSIIYEKREITEPVTDVSITFAYSIKTNGLPKEQAEEKHQHFPRNERELDQSCSHHLEDTDAHK